MLMTKPSCLYRTASIILLCLISFVNTNGKNPFRHTDVEGSDGYKTQVVDICNEYVQNSSLFTYGSKYAAFRHDIKRIKDRYEINCSTFSMLVSYGIKFQNTKYEGGTNNGMFRSEYADNLITWFSDGGADDRNIKYSRDIAKKLYEDGYGMIPDKDLSNLDTGDILFFNLDPSNDRPNIDFMGVDHSAIFGYRFGDGYVIYEVGDDKGPKRVLKTRDSMSKVVLVGKLPRPKTESKRYAVLSSDKKRIVVNQKGNARDNYKLAELKMKDPLSKGKCYTLIVKARIDRDIWLNATYNGTSSYAFNMTNVRNYRPKDGRYLIHFTAPDDIHSLSLNVRSNDAIQISAKYKSCVLYEGIVTNL